MRFFSQATKINIYDILKKWNIRESIGARYFEIFLIKGETAQNLTMIYTDHFIKKLFVLIVILLLSLPQQSEAADQSPVRIALKTPILPVVHGVLQEIVVDIDRSALSENNEVDIEISAESGYGVLLSGNSPLLSGRLRFRADEPLVIQYRWSGPLPTESAVVERVTVFIPGLDTSAQAEFSVGIDMQIAAIRVPEDVRSGQLSPIAIEIRDNFHPDTQIEAALSALQINPELRLALLPETPPPLLNEASARVVAKFFGEGRKVSDETEFPGGEFKRGLLKANDDGAFLWVSVDGRNPGIIPRIPGRYRLTVSLKPNTGGIGVKEMISQPFDVAGETPPSYGTPTLFEATMEILDGILPSAALSAAQSAKESIESGDERSAAVLLGKAYGEIWEQSTARSSSEAIGKYVDALLSSGLDIDSVARFVSDFLAGYNGYGVIILSKSGVKTWSADLQRQASITGDKYVVIPFDTSNNFILNLEGSGEGDTSLWKSVPQGVNKKIYPAGDWDKQITVNTGRLTPP
jgi:hypothetical protein